MISGIKFVFDSEKEPFHRILKEDIIVNKDPLDYEKKYRMATKYYVGIGKDDYTMLIDCPYLINEVEG